MHDRILGITGGQQNNEVGMILARPIGKLATVETRQPDIRKKQIVRVYECQCGRQFSDLEETRSINAKA